MAYRSDTKHSGYGEPIRGESMA